MLKTSVEDASPMAGHAMVFEPVPRVVADLSGGAPRRRAGRRSTRAEGQS